MRRRLRFRRDLPPSPEGPENRRGCRFNPSTGRIRNGGCAYVQILSLSLRVIRRHPMPAAVLPLPGQRRRHRPHRPTGADRDGRPPRGQRGRQAPPGRPDPRGQRGQQAPPGQPDPRGQRERQAPPGRPDPRGQREQQAPPGRPEPPARKEPCPMIFSPPSSVPQNCLPTEASCFCFRPSQILPGQLRSPI